MKNGKMRVCFVKSYIALLFFLTELSQPNVNDQKKTFLSTHCYIKIAVQYLTPEIMRFWFTGGGGSGGARELDLNFERFVWKLWGKKLFRKQLFAFSSA